MENLEDLGIETPELDGLDVDQIQEKLKDIVPNEDEREELQQKALESLSDNQKSYLAEYKQATEAGQETTQAQKDAYAAFVDAEKQQAAQWLVNKQSKLESSI